MENIGTDIECNIFILLNSFNHKFSVSNLFLQNLYTVNNNFNTNPCVPENETTPRNADISAVPASSPEGVKGAPFEKREYSALN